MDKFVYADNAASTVIDKIVLDEMMPFLTDLYANPSGGHSFSVKSYEAIEKARSEIAGCIGCDAGEIVFTSGGSESNSLAIIGSSRKKGRIITSSAEHKSVLNSCISLEHTGKHITILPVCENGITKKDSLINAFQSETSLVSLMLVNNETGSLQPIECYSRFIHSQGALFHTDAVQAVGHIPIDVKRLGVDLLSASAHKFGGPKGTGFLYVSADCTLFPQINGGNHENGLRSGTPFVAGIVGMAAALKERTALLNQRAAYIDLLEQRILDGLRQYSVDFRVNSESVRIPGILSISFRDADAEMLMHRLDMLGVYVSTGAACDSGSNEISHVIRAMNVPEKYARGTVRISMSHNNTPEESDYIAHCISNILKRD